MTIPSAVEAHETTSLRRPPGALSFWSVLGAVVVAFAVYSWIRWAFSSEFTPPPTGSDDYSALWYLRTLEVVSMTAVLLMLWFWVVRPWRRDRHVPLDGKILLGMMFAYVVDPTLNIFNHSFAMNAHSVSFGSWAESIPVFPSPGQERFAEGLLWAPQLYMYFGLLAAMAGCWLLDRLRGRFPTWSTPRIYAIVFVIFMVGDCVAELALLVYPQVYVFPGVPEHFSLFAGELYQFPLYQSVFAAVFASMVTWLRDSRDSSGRSAVERGVDDLDVSPLRRRAMSFLAVTGFCTVSALGYFLPYGYATMTADTYIELPSYLAPAAYCGVEGKPLCPSEYLDHLQKPTD
jgi:hypothetical protein